MAYPIQDKRYTISKMEKVKLKLFLIQERETELEFIILTKGEPNKGQNNSKQYIPDVFSFDELSLNKYIFDSGLYWQMQLIII